LVNHYSSLSFPFFSLSSPWFLYLTLFKKSI
jgi:hypothetical protein